MLSAAAAAALLLRIRVSRSVQPGITRPVDECMLRGVRESPTYLSVEVGARVQ